MKKEINPRFAAYESLMRCEKDQKYSNLEIDAAIGRYSMNDADRRLYTSLVYGVIEKRLRLDYAVSLLSSKPISEIDSKVMNLLRLGIYQIAFLDRIPESAAVNESVELCKRIKPAAASFINGILRNYLRKFGRTAPEPPKDDFRNYLSVKYSVSPDIVDILGTSCGDPEALLDKFSQKCGITLRVNTLRTSRKEVMDMIADSGLEAEPTIYSDFGIKISGGRLLPPISDLIEKGFVYIQDEASQIAVTAADPRAGMSVIDCCACPGGKSFSAAIMMNNCGQVKSFDLHRSKLSLVKKGAEKLGIGIITVEEKDGRIIDESLSGSADLVICDVPCSGLGVISKKPEIRYKSIEDIGRLPKTQLAILTASAKYVKSGGVLCYSTCTLNPEENEKVVEEFADSADGFDREDFSVGRIKSSKGMVTLYPHIHDTDGFFIAKFRKR